MRTGGRRGGRPGKRMGDRVGWKEEIVGAGLFGFHRDRGREVVSCGRHRWFQIEANAPGHESTYGRVEEEKDEFFFIAGEEVGQFVPLRGGKLLLFVKIVD